MFSKRLEGGYREEKVDYRSEGRQGRFNFEYFFLLVKLKSTGVSTPQEGNTKINHVSRSISHYGAYKAGQNLYNRFYSYLKCNGLVDYLFFTPYLFTSNLAPAISERAAEESEEGKGYFIVPSSEGKEARVEC